MSKKCIKCGELKPPTEFYKHPNCSDGTENTCKRCKVEYVSGWYIKNKDHKRDYDTARRNGKIPTKQPPKWTREFYRTYSHVDPVIRAARKRTQWQASHGQIVREPCQACGAVVKTEAHHENYNEPDQVTWLCRSCHRSLHGKQRRKDYGALLRQ